MNHNCQILPYHPPCSDIQEWDYNGGCCSGEVTTPVPKYPTTGPLKESAFVLNDSNPYLFDTSVTSYGPVLYFSEHIYTNITQRDSVSCIDLAATFDMTDTDFPNDVRLDMIKNIIGNKYTSLNGVLPIIKHDINFRILYTVTDSTGGIVYEGICHTSSLENSFHFTDIKDRFIMSTKNIVIDMIPQLPTSGVYTITINRVEAFVGVIDTYSHMTNDTNPFYKFTNNNTSITINSSVIENQSPDETILLAYCDVNRSFLFTSNITTRLKMTFTTYMSSLITTKNVSSIHDTLSSPTEKILDDAISRISELEKQVKELQTKLDNYKILMDKMSNEIQNNSSDIKKNAADIKKNSVDIGNNRTSITKHDKDIESIKLRLDKLERIPLATLSYVPGREFVSGQITWVEHGKLYQATTDFTAVGDINIDINNGRLIPIKSD